MVRHYLHHMVNNSREKLSGTCFAHQYSVNEVNVQCKLSNFKLANHTTTSSMIKHLWVGFRFYRSGVHT